MNIYSATATGDVAPLERITGPQTLLSTVLQQGVAVDANHNVYVTAHGAGSLTNSINVYSAGAYGDVQPSAVISGAHTGLYVDDGITVDTSNNIYVANMGGYNCSSTCGYLTVYAAGASGDAQPIQEIFGLVTGVYFPCDIAVDRRKNIYALNCLLPAVVVFSAGANGSIAPIQFIEGSRTGLNSAGGLAVDAKKNIYVTQAKSIEIFAAGANGNVPPVRTITGPNTRLNGPSGIALDRSGNMYVANNNGLSVNVYASNANGNSPPIRIISGPRTGLSQIVYRIAVR